MVPTIIKVPYLVLLPQTVLFSLWSTANGNMNVPLSGHMGDDRRGLLTDNERKILLGEKEVSDNHYYTTVSRVRSKIKQVEEDLEALEAHGELAMELREAVCDSPDDV